MVILPFKLRRVIGEIPIDLVIMQSPYKSELVVNIEEILNIVKENNGQYLKLFYFNKENIHNVLYQEEEVISIDDTLTRKLSNLFYLDLLIKENDNFVDYIFSKESLISLHKELLNLKVGPKKIILAKIIFDFIENFKGFGKYDENLNENRLENLSNLCKKEIQDEIKRDKSLLSDISIDNILEMKIDHLYAEIIIRLFKSDSFSYDNITNIFRELEMEYIFITENLPRPSCVPRGL